MNERKKRNIIIGSLCAVLLLMVVGYAAFSTALNINGTSSISSNWDIKITKITSNVLKGSATNASEPTGVNTLTASFETNLVSPGDSMEYVITVTNSGSLDATLEKITMSQPDNEYVTFAASINGEAITAGENMTFTEATQTLNAGESKDIKVIVTFKNVTISKMEPTASKLTLTLDYAQAGGSGGADIPSGPKLTTDDLIATAVETGDGLYVDTYETGRYVYKGTNPSNYIMFNDELWRILAIEADGTLKIKRNESVLNRSWGPIRETDWAITTLNTYLNETYYNTLSETAKSQIQAHNFDIGSITAYNTDLAAQILSEKSKQWNGNIGLMTVSDAIRANSNINACGNIKNHSGSCYTCKTTNYLVSSNYGGVWTISTGTNFDVYILSRDGAFSTNGANSADPQVEPVVYLNTDILLSGEGTSENPYIIVS